MHVTSQHKIYTSDSFALLTAEIINPTTITTTPIQTKLINGLMLASIVQKEKKSNSLSFTDSESKYLIRIVKTELQTLLLLFSEDKSKKDFKLTFYPSKNYYNITYISKPIEILAEATIDKILIT